MLPKPPSFNASPIYRIAEARFQILEFWNFGISKFWNFQFSKFPDYDATVPTVLIGCAPCQGFTAYRKKSWNQPDTRNSLVEAFADVAVSMQPDCVIIHISRFPKFQISKFWNIGKIADFNKINSLALIVGISNFPIFQILEFPIFQFSKFWNFQFSKIPRFQILEIPTNYGKSMT